MVICTGQLQINMAMFGESQHKPQVEHNTSLQNSKNKRKRVKEKKILLKVSKNLGKSTNFWLINFNYLSFVVNLLCSRENFFSCELLPVFYTK